MRALASVLAALCLLVLPLAPAQAEADTFYVEGHGSVPLSVTVTGPEDGPEVLFLHGIGMGADSFSPQLNSELAERYRMVAIDLRGHGMSGKPHKAEAYTLREVWAEDVRRVIAATGLKKPVIVAWSYGTLVTADYLLAEGGDAISGLIMVGAHGGIAPPSPRNEPPDPAVMAEMARYYQLRASSSLADQQAALEILAPYLYEVTETGPSKEWQSRARILGLMVPPYAQPHLRAHPMDNAALAAVLAETHVMLVHGTRDFAVTPADVEAAKKAIPHLEVHTVVGGGHSPFAEDPARFNALLAGFVDENWSSAHVH